MPQNRMDAPQITTDPLPWAHDHENLCDETRMSGQHPARSATKEAEEDYWDPRPIYSAG